MATENENTNEEDTTTDETVTTQEKKEKVLTQSEVNALLAKEKRDWTKKLEKVQSDYDTLQASFLEKEQAEEKRTKEIVDGMKEGLPKSITSLLDMLPVKDQLEFLSNKDNDLTVDSKKVIPQTPKEKGDGTKQPKPIGTIF